MQTNLFRRLEIKNCTIVVVYAYWIYSEIIRDNDNDEFNQNCIDAV